MHILAGETNTHPHRLQRPSHKYPHPLPVVQAELNVQIHNTFIDNIDSFLHHPAEANSVHTVGADNTFSFSILELQTRHTKKHTNTNHHIHNYWSPCSHQCGPGQCSVCHTCSMSHCSIRAVQCVIYAHTCNLNYPTATAAMECKCNS